MTSKKRKKPHLQARRRRRRGILLYALIPIAVLLLVVGVWLLGTPASSPGTSEGPQFPAWLLAMGPQTERSYTQAVAHRDELRYVPCYCGCGGLGHTAVVDCHIASVAGDGSITYERHSST